MDEVIEKPPKSKGRRALELLPKIAIEWGHRFDVDCKDREKNAVWMEMIALIAEQEK